MGMSSPPPFSVFLARALLIPFARGKLRTGVLLLIPVVSGLNLLQMEEGRFWILPFLDYELIPVRVDGLSLLFGYLFHLASFLAVVFALHVRDITQHVAGLLYAGSAIGAVFAGDLLTLFIFWELMAVSSVFLILARRTERAMSMGLRYLLGQV